MIVLFPLSVGVVVLPLFPPLLVLSLLPPLFVPPFVFSSFFGALTNAATACANALFAAATSSLSFPSTAVSAAVMASETFLKLSAVYSLSTNAFAEN